MFEYLIAGYVAMMLLKGWYIGQLLTALIASARLASARIHGTYSVFDFAFYWIAYPIAAFVMVSLWPILLFHERARIIQPYSKFCMMRTTMRGIYVSRGFRYNT